MTLPEAIYLDLRRFHHCRGTSRSEHLDTFSRTWLRALSLTSTCFLFTVYAGLYKRVEYQRELNQAVQVRGARVVDVELSQT